MESTVYEADNQLTTTEPPDEHLVDARGLRCPLPLLRAKQALRDLAPGERLRVLATDGGSVRDFRAFAELSGHSLVLSDEHEGVYTYILVKANT